MYGVFFQSYERVLQLDSGDGYRTLCVLSCSVTLDSFRPHGLLPTRLLCPWDFPRKNTGVGCLALLQGIFLARDRRRILYHWAALHNTMGALNTVESDILNA